METPTPAARSNRNSLLTLALLAGTLGGLAPAQRSLAQTGSLQAQVQYQNRDGGWFDCDRYKMFFSCNGVLAGSVAPAAGTFAGFATWVPPDRNGMLNWRVQSYVNVDNVGRVADRNGITYSATSTWSLPRNSNGTLTIHAPTSNTLAGKAFEIMRPIVAEYNFFKGLGATLPYVQINMHAGLTGGGSAYYNDPNRPYINMDPNTAHSLDVIMHEYGHMVAFKNGMSKARDAGVSGNHSFGADNIKSIGRRNGSLLAWSEAVATDLGNMAKMEGNVRASGWPARDIVPQYYQVNAAGNRGVFSVSLETRETWAAGRAAGSQYQDIQGLGEGDELSVTRAVWDFYDGHAASGSANEAYGGGRRDRVNYGARRTWEQALNTTTTFWDCWRNISGDMGTAAGRRTVSNLETNKQAEAVAACGEILEEAGISHKPMTEGVLRVARPLLEWTEQNNGNSMWFRALIFNLDWTLKYDSGLQNDPHPNAVRRESFRVTEDLAAGDYRWVILNDPAIARRADLEGRETIYSWYWSGANAFTINVPTPGTFALLMLGGVIAGKRRRS